MKHSLKIQSNENALDIGVVPLFVHVACHRRLQDAMAANATASGALAA